MPREKQLRDMICQRNFLFFLPDAIKWIEKWAENLAILKMFS